eukprot:PhF_6_TR34655/c0_g1_i1/m.50425/K17506/PPM1L, PP2CE; protein phosphatase 1L
MYQWGCCELKGNRSSMEDVVTIERIGMGLTCIGVFDGHGGDVVANYCAEHIHHHVSLAYERKGNPSEALIYGLDTLKYDLYNQMCCRKRGTTALVALLDESRQVITIANVGDSRAIRSNGQRLTRDHNWGDKEELGRVAQLGGRLECGTLNSLCVSRAIGDLDWNPFVTSQPDIFQHQFSNGLIVLATDGLWNVVEDQQAGEYAWKSFLSQQGEMQKGNVTPRPICGEVARRIANHAWTERGSNDNISVVVVACNH